MSYWIAAHNQVPSLALETWIQQNVDSDGWSDLESQLAQQLPAIRAEHHVSVLWLLLPIILTTAFVIYGAWRRAVRDAEAGAVDEDE